MTPGISTILKIGLATGNNMLKSLRLEAERANNSNNYNNNNNVF